MFYGFAQPLVPALGYGNVVHEIVKNIHKAAMAGETIDKEDVKRMIDESFYLPYATKKLAENMYKSVTKAINHYVEHNRQQIYGGIICRENVIERTAANVILTTCV